MYGYPNELRLITWCISLSQSSILMSRIIHGCPVELECLLLVARCCGEYRFRGVASDRGALIDRTQFVEFIDACDNPERDALACLLYSSDRKSLRLRLVPGWRVVHWSRLAILAPILVKALLLIRFLFCGGQHGPVVRHCGLPGQGAGRHDRSLSVAVVVANIQKRIQGSKYEAGDNLHNNAWRFNFDRHVAVFGVSVSLSLRVRFVAMSVKTRCSRWVVMQWGQYQKDLLDILLSRLKITPLTMTLQQALPGANFFSGCRSCSENYLPLPDQRRLT